MFFKKMLTPDRRKVQDNKKRSQISISLAAPPQPLAHHLSPEKSSVIQSQDLSCQLQAILARSSSVYGSPPRLTTSTKASTQPASLPNAEGLLSEADLVKFQKKIALMKERIKQGLGSLGETPIKGPDVTTPLENLSQTETQPSLDDRLLPLQHQHRDQRWTHGTHSGSTNSGSNGYSVSVGIPSPQLPSVSSSARVLEPAHSTDVGPVATRALTQQKRRALVSRIADRRCRYGPGKAVSEEGQHLHKPVQLDRCPLVAAGAFEPRLQLQIDSKPQHCPGPSRWNTFVLALLGLAPASSLVPTPTATATVTTPLRPTTITACGSTLPQARLQSSTRRPLLRLVLAVYSLTLLFMLRITICSLLRSPLEAAVVSGRTTEAVDLINKGSTGEHDDSTHLGWGMALQRTVCASCKGDHPLYLGT